MSSAIQGLSNVTKHSRNMQELQTHLTASHERLIQIVEFVACRQKHVTFIYRSYSQLQQLYKTAILTYKYL